MNCKTVLLKDLVLGEKGSYGIGAPAVDYDPKKYTYLRITDINDDGSINTNGLKSVDAEDAYKYILQENDIVFARTGASTGKTYFYQPQDGTLVYAGFLIKFSIDPQKVNPRLLKYITHSQEYYNWVRSFDTGGTRGNINAVTFANMPITLPDRATQDKIVAILSSLDDKIELNRRINANLEQQAQALYKSWFVDFEPFGGKMPEDWKEGRLEDIGEVVGGGTPSKSISDYYTSNGIAWITPKDLSLTHAKFTSKGEIDITELGYVNSSAKLMPRGSILFSSRAPIGYISIAKNDVCTNQGFKSVIPYNGCTAYIYYYLLANTLNIEAQASGSTFKEASGTLMKSLDILIPDDITLAKFEHTMHPFLEQQELIEEQNYDLSNLRDTLLPRLMKGEY